MSLAVFRFVGRDGFVGWMPTDGAESIWVAPPPPQMLSPFADRGKEPPPMERRRFLLMGFGAGPRPRPEYVEDGRTRGSIFGGDHYERLLTAASKAYRLLADIAPLGHPAIINAARELDIALDLVGCTSEWRPR